MRANSKGIGGHQRPHRGATDVWLSPPTIVTALGPFDLDPCCPKDMPWQTAERMVSLPTDGLSIEWRGRVWLNPPYGPETGEWLEKLATHGSGTALVFARTETESFQTWVWGCATACLFIFGRLHFHYPSGERAKCNSGAPSVLVAYGDYDAKRLRDSGIQGRYVQLTKDRTDAATQER